MSQKRLLVHFTDVFLGELKFCNYCGIARGRGEAIFLKAVLTLIINMSVLFKVVKSINFLHVPQRSPERMKTLL